MVLPAYASAVCDVQYASCQVLRHRSTDTANGGICLRARDSLSSTLIVRSAVCLRTCYGMPATTAWFSLRLRVIAVAVLFGITGLLTALRNVIDPGTQSPLSA
eukprot:1793003-Rhodomonas_salina.2